MARKRPVAPPVPVLVGTPAVWVMVHLSACLTVVLSPVRVATKSMGPPRVLNCPSAWGQALGQSFGYVRRPEPAERWQPRR